MRHPGLCQDVFLATLQLVLALSLILDLSRLPFSLLGAISYCTSGPWTPCLEGRRKDPLDPVPVITLHNVNNIILLPSNTPNGEPLVKVKLFRRKVSGTIFYFRFEDFCLKMSFLRLFSYGLTKLRSVNFEPVPSIPLDRQPTTGGSEHF